MKFLTKKIEFCKICNVNLNYSCIYQLLCPHAPHDKLLSLLTENYRSAQKILWIKASFLVLPLSILRMFVIKKQFIVPYVRHRSFLASNTEMQICSENLCHFLYPLSYGRFIFFYCENWNFKYTSCLRQYQSGLFFVRAVLLWWEHRHLSLIFASLGSICPLIWLRLTCRKLSELYVSLERLACSPEIEWSAR